MSNRIYIPTYNSVEFATLDRRWNKKALQSADLEVFAFIALT